ncbi:MAG: hypothetical protein HDT42_09170 [Ruminococcaceae bacterium]|nr:hypothetical protein [Oscillospiraceae bacterium]
MKKIKIIGGRYGYISPSGVYNVKTPDDPPFEVDNAEAERLIKRGVAEIIGAGAAVLAKGVADDEKLPATPADDDENDDESEYDDIPKYNKESTNSELQAIAKEYGIEIPPHANKAQIIEILDNYFADSPVLNAKEPE